MLGGQITTKRLRLTRITNTDLKHINALHSDPLVARYNTIGIPNSLDDTFAVLRAVLDELPKEQPLKYGWIIKTESGVFVGEIGLGLAVSRYKKGEIHFSLMPEFWGQGYAMEAAKAVLEFGFNTLNLRRIEAGVAVDNVKSIGLIERLGLQREGRHKEILPLAQGWTDNYSYAVLKSDYDKQTHSK